MKKFSCLLIGVLAMSVLFSNCQKDIEKHRKNQPEPTADERISINDVDLPGDWENLGLYHNEVLDLWADACLQAINDGTEIPNKYEFIAEYFNQDIAETAYQMSFMQNFIRITSPDEWMNYIDNNAQSNYGGCSSEFYEAKKDMWSFIFNHSFTSNSIQELKQDILSRNYASVNELSLMKGACSILESSYDYWSNDENVAKWEVIRNDPPPADGATNNPHVNFIASILAGGMSIFIGVGREPSATEYDIAGFMWKIEQYSGCNEANWHDGIYGEAAVCSSYYSSHCGF